MWKGFGFRGVVLTFLLCLPTVLRATPVGSSEVLKQLAVQTSPPFTFPPAAQSELPFFLTQGEASTDARAAVRQQFAAESVVPTLALPESGTLLLLGLGLAGIARFLRGKKPQ